MKTKFENGALNYGDTELEKFLKEIDELNLYGRSHHFLDKFVRFESNSGSHGSLSQAPKARKGSLASVSSTSKNLVLDNVKYDNPSLNNSTHISSKTSSVFVSRKNSLQQENLLYKKKASPIKKHIEKSKPKQKIASSRVKSPKKTRSSNRGPMDKLNSRRSSGGVNTKRSSIKSPKKPSMKPVDSCESDRNCGDATYSFRPPQDGIEPSSQIQRANSPTQQDSQCSSPSLSRLTSRVTSEYCSPAKYDGNDRNISVLAPENKQAIMFSHSNFFAGDSQNNVSYELSDFVPMIQDSPPMHSAPGDPNMYETAKFEVGHSFKNHNENETDQQESSTNRSSPIKMQDSETVPQSPTIRKLNFEEMDTPAPVRSSGTNVDTQKSLRNENEFDLAEFITFTTHGNENKDDEIEVLDNSVIDENKKLFKVLFNKNLRIGNKDNKKSKEKAKITNMNSENAVIDKKQKSESSAKKRQSPGRTKSKKTKGRNGSKSVSVDIKRELSKESERDHQTTLNQSQNFVMAFNESISKISEVDVRKSLLIDVEDKHESDSGGDEEYFGPISPDFGSQTKEMAALRELSRNTQNTIENRSETDNSNFCESKTTEKPVTIPSKAQVYLKNYLPKCLQKGIKPLRKK